MIPLCDDVAGDFEDLRQWAFELELDPFHELLCRSVVELVEHILREQCGDVPS